MHNSLETESISETKSIAKNEGAITTAHQADAGLRALGVGLPAEQDAYLKAIVDRAVNRCRGGGFDTKRLLAAFTSGQYTYDDFQTILAALDTRDRGSTSQARVSAWLMGLATLRPDHRARVSDTLRNLLKKRPSHLLMSAGQRMFRGLAMTGIFALVLSLVGACIGTGPEIATFIGLALLIILMLFPPILIYLHVREMNSARELRYLCSQALGRLAAVEAVDALAAAATETADELRQMAAASLEAVIPHLKAEHYGQFGSDVTPELCKALRRYAPVVPALYNSPPAHNPLWLQRSSGIASEVETTRFVLSMLSALEKVGDPRAIATVEQISRHWPAGPAADAARATLAALEERRRQETERATLLRGAALPAVSQAELLRAAAAQAESRPEQLLRPMD